MNPHLIRFVLIYDKIRQIKQINKENKTHINFCGDLNFKLF